MKPVTPLLFVVLLGASVIVGVAEAQDRQDEAEQTLFG